MDILKATTKAKRGDILAGSPFQKLKLLYVHKILIEKSDEQNPMSAEDIIQKLDKCGIPAERKSIYQDINILEDFGVDIVRCAKGYYIGQRSFELPELKILADAVVSANFISAKKTKELVNKLVNQTSEAQRKYITSDIYIEGRPKSDNEQIYYCIDNILTAIINRKKITFEYTGYNIKKERYSRRDGMLYKLSPYSLLWFDERYYLVGNYDKYNNLSHYRVDRMKNLTVIDEPRRSITELEGCEKGFNAAQYVKGLYSMFAGEQKIAELRFSNNLINDAIDRFGKETAIYPDGRDHFRVRIKAAFTHGFIGWLLSLQSDVEVLSPPELREKMKEAAADILNVYDK